MNAQLIQQTQPRMETARYQRRLPVGAEVQPDGGVHFRVWAPKYRHVQVVVESPTQSSAGLRLIELHEEADGYHVGFSPDAGDGTLYRFKLEGTSTLFPDPASRFQPLGPHGPSQVIDPDTFSWTDQHWRGPDPNSQVVYEMHIGTFTREGTWRAAERELPELAALGITTLEVMPVAEFPGRFGWGYDGVDLFAPTRLYGEPDDFRHFVDRAHALGLAVILDVVYNHLGPDGNYLRQYSDDYFSDRHKTEWGEAINFDGPNAAPVREFFLANAGYWIDEFHLDGLRLDATQALFDDSPEHIIAAVRRRVREKAGRRRTWVVAEDESQRTRLVRPVRAGGYGLDAVWNDDFHHSAMVALSAHNEAYYSDYLGAPQEFIAAIKWGFLYQGQYYHWQMNRRGKPSLDRPPTAFVHFLQNHDQIANSMQGLRCHTLTSPGRLRALTALLLLAPQTPMLFQGQEFAASSPFTYFADHHSELARLVCNGRREFLSQFRSLALPEPQGHIPDPGDASAFHHCKLNFAERELHAPIYNLHKDLLQLRRKDPIFRAPRSHGVDGAVLREQAFVLRYFTDNGADRLLIINLGRDLHLVPAPEPLLAPPEGKRWAVLWSSEEVRYGGSGAPAVDVDQGWRLQGEATVVLVPELSQE